MKECKNCKNSLELSEFYKHPYSKDGLFSDCKTCVKQIKALRYVSKPKIDVSCKMCSQCRKEHQISFYYKSSTGYLSSKCKWCVSNARKSHYRKVSSGLLYLREIKSQLKKSNVFTNFSL